MANVYHIGEHRVWNIPIMAESSIGQQCCRDPERQCKESMKPELSVFPRKLSQAANMEKALTRKPRGSGALNHGPALLSWAALRWNGWQQPKQGRDQIRSTLGSGHTEPIRAASLVAVKNSKSLRPRRPQGPQ